MLWAFRILASCCITGIYIRFASREAQGFNSPGPFSWMLMFYIISFPLSLKHVKIFFAIIDSVCTKKHLIIKNLFYIPFSPATSFLKVESKLADSKLIVFFQCKII